MTYTAYYLYFESNPTKGYVGITNNLSRRIIQHKSESKVSNTTKKHRWMNKHLKTEKLKHKVIAKYDTWEDALLDEPKLIKQYKDDGYELVNLSTGGEGNQGPTGITPPNVKSYAIIKDAKVFYITGLVSWCKANKLSHGNMHNCLKGKLRHAQGYIIFFRSDWDNFSIEEKETILDSYYSTIAVNTKTEHLSKYIVYKSCKIIDTVNNIELKFNTYSEAITHLKCGVGTFYTYLDSDKLFRNRFKITR